MLILNNYNKQLFSPKNADLLRVYIHSKFCNNENSVPMHEKNNNIHVGNYMCSLNFVYICVCYMILFMPSFMCNEYSVIQKKFGYGIRLRIFLSNKVMSNLLKSIILWRLENGTL